MPEIPILAWTGAYVVVFMAHHFSMPVAPPLFMTVVNSALLSTYFAMSQYVEADIASKVIINSANAVVALSSYITAAKLSPLTVGYLITGMLETHVQYNKEIPHTNSLAEKHLPYVADIATLSLGAPLIYQSHTRGGAPTTILHGFSLLKTIALTHHVAEIAAPLVAKRVSDAMDTAYEYWEAAKEVDWVAVLCSLDMAGSSTTAAENLEI